MPFHPVRVMITGMTSIDSDIGNLEPWTSTMLGDNFLAYLTLALGAALVAGNAVALLKPRTTEDGTVVRAPVGRSLIQITVGGLASIWALATIVS